MPALRFSRRAEGDLRDIAIYTVRAWSVDQASRYLDELEACCRTLASNPKLGRVCDVVRPGLRRMECGRHAIFYRTERGGILVVRVLHQRMLPELQAMEEGDG